MLCNEYMFTIKKLLNLHDKFNFTHLIILCKHNSNPSKWTLINSIKAYAPKVEATEKFIKKSDTLLKGKIETNPNVN